jgi:predicted transcriptional regulator
MATGKALLSDELREQIEQVAPDQNREPVEVLEDAVRKYLQDQKWPSLVRKGEQREVRAENRGR